MPPGFWIVALILSILYGNIQASSNKAGALDQGNEHDEHNVEKKGKIWAVLVAGSYGWSDYRFQADVCHAYQIFRAHGIPDKQIIVMMYDDIAQNSENPTPGVIINKPNGPNVYSHVPKDYTGANVTPENFLNIITGNKSAMKGVGSGKVLQSGPNDHVFINFVDRGSSGLVAFPFEYLYADQLIDAFNTMFNNKMYKQLLVYVESSDSGSMFDGLLPTNQSILAVTAAQPYQDSYATYYDSYREVYLGDLWSVAWMEDIDSEEHHKNLTSETLLQQYNNVKKRTSAYSDPAMYGTQRIAKSKIINFFGKDKNKTLQTIEDEIDSEPFKNAVKSRDVHLHTLQKRIQGEGRSEEKQILQNKLGTLLKGRRGIEDLLDRIIGRLPIVDPSTISESRRPLTKGLLSCYKTVVDAFNKQCVNITKNPFVLRHLYKFVNICSASGLSTDQVLATFRRECISPNSFNNVQ